MKKKAKNIASIIILSLLIIFEASALILAFSDNSSSPAQTFCFFTNDSNILLLLSSLPMLAYQIENLRTEKAIPHWAYLFFQIAAVGTSLTFFIVFTMLLPAMGLFILSGYKMISLHVICPLLALSGHYFFFGNGSFKTHEAFYGLIPMGVYGLIIVTLILSVPSFEPPYFFLDVRKQPLYMSFIYIALLSLLTFLISFLLVFFQARAQKAAEAK